VRVNLLERESLRGRDLARPVVRAVPLLLVTVAVAAALAHVDAARWAWTLSRVEAERRMLEARAAAVRRLHADVARLESRVADAERLRLTGPRMESALAELAVDLPSTSWLTSLTIEDDGSLRIAGRATAFASVGSVLASLDRSAAFGKSALLDAQRPARATTLRFQIETRRADPGGR